MGMIATIDSYNLQGAHLKDKDETCLGTDISVVEAEEWEVEGWEGKACLDQFS